MIAVMALSPYLVHPLPPCFFAQDPAYESGQFKDIKPIILGMLDTCNYEEVSKRTVLSPATSNVFVHLFVTLVYSSLGRNSDLFLA